MFLFSRIGITSPGDFYNIDLNHINIEKGSEVLIKVRPEALESNDDIKDNAIND